MIEIYFKDLTEEKQKEIIEALGNNGNYDVFPVAEIETDNDILKLEFNDLLYHDIGYGDIKVSKDVFDDFKPDTYVRIQFIDINDSNIYEFVMVAEDEDGILMRYIDRY